MSEPAGRLVQLPGIGDPTVQAPGPSRAEVADHPMRRITREVAFDPHGWGPGRAAKIAELFDGMAPTWHEIAGGSGRLAAVEDALDRGGVVGGRCLELGSGTGSATALLTRRFDAVLASDLSIEMLRRAPSDVATRVWADSSRLPVRSGSVHAVVLMNMFLFRHEVERVLHQDGAVVWISSLGDRTPIYLSASDLLEALGGGWHGVAGACGESTWCVARRVRTD